MTATAAGAAGEDRRDEFDLGVLLVHGIGAQARGETLAAFGGPIRDWLDAWLEGIESRWLNQGVTFEEIRGWFEEHRDAWAAGGHDVGHLRESLRRLLEAAQAGPPAGALTARDSGSTTLGGRADFVHAPGPSAAGPAHADLDITYVDVAGNVTRRRWRLAESWWADTFPPPGFGEVARWLLTVVPRTVASHYAATVHRRWRELRQRPLRRAPGPAIRLVTAAAMLLVAVALSPVLLLGIAVLLVVALIPNARLRTALRRLQQRVASTLGDSYVLLARPVEGAAIVDQVRRDLRWLAADCRQVAVIAHSQGGAVVHEALRRERPERLRLLLTFGSGLKKLSELRFLLGPGGSFARSATITVVGFWVLVLAILGGWAALTTEPVSSGSRWALLAYGAIGAAIFGVGVADLLRAPPDRELSWWADVLVGAGVRWQDIHASDDPVPSGALFDHHPPGAKNPESLPIENLRSFTGDHGAYWENRDVFVTEVVTSLAALDDRALPEFEVSSVRAQTARKVRSSRVRWLVAVRYLSVVAAVAAIVRNANQQAETLAWGWYRVADYLGISAREAELEAGAAWAGWAPLAAVGAVYLGLRWFWQRWDARESGVMFGGPARSHWYEVSATLGIAVIATLAVGVSVTGPVERYVGWAFAGAFLVATVALVVARGGVTSSEPAGKAVAEARLPAMLRSAWNWAQAVTLIAVLVYFLPRFVQEVIRAATPWSPGFWPVFAGTLALLAVAGRKSA